MHGAQEDEKSRLKLAQLWRFVKRTYRSIRKTYSHNRVVNEILKDDFNINCKVTVHPYEQKSEIHLKDCTALHFVYHDILDIDTFTTLLERGVDFTIKNGNGQTVIHMVITNDKINDSSYTIDNEIEFVNSVLSAHVKFQNFVNPRDNSGFTHLHGACIANHVEAAEFFLENGASVDDAVNFDARRFAGYTSLHFAVGFHCFEAARILVSHGANVNAQTAKEKTPLDLLIESNYNSRSSQVNILENEQMMKLLVEKGGISNFGFSSLHLACTFGDLTDAERISDRGADVNYAVPTNSPVCPGDTALHFAAFNRVEAVKMLLTRGAKIDAANAHEQTALDVCLNRYSLPEICNILSCIEGWQDIRLSNGTTRLMDLIATMRDSKQFKLFLQNEVKNITTVVSIYSVLWPGYTILHLAVTLSKNVCDSEEFNKQDTKMIVEECLNRGMSPNVQNVKGQTPIHLAFSQDKSSVAKLMLDHLDALNQLMNLVDRDNLSYLHITCAMRDEFLVEKLLEHSGSNIAYRGNNGFIQPGSSPLHVAIFHGSHIIADMLLRHGADLHATDERSLTPVHVLMLSQDQYDEQRIVNVMFDSLLIDPTDRVVDDLGLSYLHVACFFGNAEVVKKLLDLGSNVNPIIKYDENSHELFSPLKRYSNYTPLQITAERRNNDEILDLLLRRGADLMVEESPMLPRCNPIQKKHVVRRFLEVLCDREDMQKRVQQRFGLTKLHIACYVKNEEAIRTALEDGFGVNVPVYADSEIFAGWTPLHMLTTVTDWGNWYNLHVPESGIEGSINLLVDRGADVTIANADKDTSIHVFYKHQTAFFNIDRCKDLLLKAQQNFSVNPVNAEGLSHFHLACSWHNLEVVGKFLQHGLVDVNRPVDWFARFDAGCTPLHLTLSSSVETNDEWIRLSKTVDLLLMKGADVTAKNARGDTPLHQPAVMCSPGMCILEKLVSCGGDVKSKNLRGQTPIEVYPDIFRANTNLSDYVTIFQKYEHRINSWNRLTGEGYIPKIFLSSQEKLSENPEFENFMKSSDVRAVDNAGRTAIHNSVALSEERYSRGKIENYIYAIDSFIKIDINIDHQDDSGQTALHYAAKMENVIGVEALLACGADVNIVDSRGKSAFSYATEHSNNKRNLCCAFEKNVTIVLRLHMKKLQHLRIEVSQLNQNLVEQVQHFFDIAYYSDSGRDLNHLSQKFFSQIEMTKTLDIVADSVFLFHFLSETGAVNSYPFWQQSKRCLVDEFFKSTNYADFGELLGIIKLQYRKVKTRLGLTDSALSSLNTLLGFSTPGLCEQISLYLSNSDLKNLIMSTRS